ncbi:MAG: hypothetical protein GXP55_20285 [Deltaproteobacteria bacterium]|nr:hypothetical protein [Deltaproteobacteria bacterium]
MRYAPILFLATAACGCATENVSNEPLSPELHECVPYTATSSSDTITGAYAVVNDQPIDSLTAPDDPGGGFFELVLTTDNADLSPGFIVTAMGDESGAIIASTAAGSMDPTTMVGGFSAAPGQVYKIEFTAGQNAPADSYPIAFTLNWTFTGTMDCYEANDTADAARQVPVGTRIEAFSLAGFETNSLPAKPYDDWYKVVLNRAATIESELITPPGDHRMRIRFWEADGTTQLANAGGSAGGETFTASASLEAGTYLMSVEVGDADYAEFWADREPPSFWRTPYTVDLREAP